MRRRLCHDIVAVDLNVIYRLMRPEWAENEPEPLPSEACSYRAIRVGESGGSVLAEPDGSREEGPHPLAHGGAGGVEGAGCALLGTRLVVCGGTTQQGYSTLASIGRLSAINVVA